MQAGDGVSVAYSFSHYYNALRVASEKKDKVNDRASGAMHAESDGFIPGSFDAYAAGAIPVIKNVVSGTGNTTVVETLDPY